MDRNWLFSAQSHAEIWVWATVRPKTWSGEGCLQIPVPASEEQHKLPAPSKQGFGVKIAETSLSTFVLLGMERGT